MTTRDQRIPLLCGAIAGAAATAAVFTLPQLLRKSKEATVSAEPVDEVSLQERPADAPESCPGVSSDSAGKAAGCARCPNQKMCASGEAKKIDPAVAEARDRLREVKRKILVLSG